MTQLQVDSRETLYVARQPILDAAGALFGYELLYRDSSGGAGGREDLAGARVLTDAVVNMGLDAITGGKPAFIRLTRPLLFQLSALLPPDTAVFELQRDIPVDDETVEMCRQLHASGYALALDDFIADSDAAALLPYAKYVKVNTRGTSASAQAALVRTFAAGGPRLIAEHVETGDAFSAATATGYHLFQGRYFSTPTMCGRAAVPGRSLAYLQLLAALNKPDIALGEIEDLVKHDVSLSYRVLRCVNSAAFAMRREIHSIRQALLLLGLAPIRSWASVWCLAGLNTGGVSELVTTALIRGRCCELLGEELREGDAAPDFFLIGLCSLLDVMLGQPMKDAIADLPLSPVARGALLGEQNAARALLDAVVAHEQGEWDDATSQTAGVGIDGHRLAQAYTSSLRWARELSQG